MGKVTVQLDTTKDPISIAGREAGICYGTDITDPQKNYKRGLKCYTDAHGRTMEFAQIYLTFEGYSAKVVREFYTHIGGSPTRLQASTRYIDYAKKGFEYVTPPSVKANPEAQKAWDDLMTQINATAARLETEFNIPKEDASNALPLAMSTTFVVRTNLRSLAEMAGVRMCSRAYHEFRQLMRDVAAALSEYSPEWATLVDMYMKPRCEALGYCPEGKSCGRRPIRAEVIAN